MAKKTIPLSVGVATFKRLQTLERMLNDLAKQSVWPMEILVSDNDSDGPSLEDLVFGTLKETANVHYIKQKENLGAAGNFNFLLQSTSQPYFMWLSDDDSLSDETYLEKLFQTLVNTKSDFAFPKSEHVYISKDGNEKRMFSRNLRLPLSDSKFRNHFKLITESYIGYQLIGGIFRREILETHIGFWHSTFFYPNVVGEGPFCHILFSRFKWGYCPEVAYIKDMTDSHDFRANAIEAFWPHFWDFVGVAGVLATSQYKGYQKAILIITFFFRNMYAYLSVAWFSTLKRLRRL
jgi:glycosyltransferase involved in cell wall biosynthesis